VSTFKDFPPTQKPQSFNLDQIMEQLQHPRKATDCGLLSGGAAGR
jgi:hypothetical protein